MTGSDLLSVEEALARVLEGIALPRAELIPLRAADGRYLADDLVAVRTQPPFACSAMDGYAMRSEGLERGARLRVIGESAAGRPFQGAVGPGEAVRIFTGAALPAGTDAVVMQEDTRPGLGRLELDVAPVAGRHVRRRGLDFTAGETLLRSGIRLDPMRLALAAACGHAAVPVACRPRIAILATGDELVLPDDGDLSADRIIASNLYAVAAMAERNGAEIVTFEILPDSLDRITGRISDMLTAEVDVLVTLGGASVGDYDLVQKALEANRFELGFWRIAMRPGKPLIHGMIGDMKILGLPGNPVSAIVCAKLFLEPLLRAMQGDREAGVDSACDAICACDLPQNDFRQDYLRAERVGAERGLPCLRPLPVQDSSMLASLARADALLVRPPHAPALSAGSTCRALLLQG